ncbi:hypothetical protein F3D21_26750 [Bacteroides ovatus]|nr:hypothetical protein F3D21_26750 [Bacteroides ovatus]
MCEKSGNEEQGFRRVMKKSYPQVIQKTKKDKKWIKGLTTFDKHDKIIKSLKQVTKKFFEN